MPAVPPPPPWLRKPNRWELVYMALMAAFCGLIVDEMVRASGAHACGTRGMPAEGCYPWGAEGPVAGYWTYRSRFNYLVSQSYFLAFIIVALIAPLVTASWRGTVVLVGTIFALHFAVVRLVASFM